MELLIGFVLVSVAGIFQGSFILPMTMTKKWQWEHSWLVFSILGISEFFITCSCVSPGDRF